MRRYDVFIMANRDQLKTLIDQLPESSLEIVQRMLEHHIQPSKPTLEIEQMRRRLSTYKSLVEQRFRETRKSGTLGGMGGGGHMGIHEGTPYGRQSFSYWDDKALVQQTLQSFAGHQLEIMERFSINSDSALLSCALELTSGGRTVNYVEEFPIATTA